MLLLGELRSLKTLGEWHRWVLIFKKKYVEQNIFGESPTGMKETDKIILKLANFAS